MASTTLVAETDDTLQEDFPSALDTCNRIKSERAEAGRKFRAEHPDLARRIREAILASHRGRSVFFPNKERLINPRDVRELLAGLGYLVQETSPMAVNVNGPFYIYWYDIDRKDPLLE